MKCKCCEVPLNDIVCRPEPVTIEGHKSIACGKQHGKRSDVDPSYCVECYEHELPIEVL